VADLTDQTMTRPGPEAGVADAPAERPLTRRTLLKAAIATGATAAAGNALAGVTRAAPAQLRQAESATLTMWHQKPELRPNFQQVFDAFKKDYPNITINQVPKPASNYSQVINTAMAAGELPDLFAVNAPDVPTQARSGQLLNLSGKVPNIANALQIARDVNFIDGKLYTVSWGRYTVVLMYNKKMLAKFGLQPPQDWVEWKTQCKKIKAAGTIPIAMAGDGTIDAFFFTELATAALGRQGFNDLLAGKKKFTAPELAQTMQFILDLVPYFQPGFLATKYADAKALFAIEKVVFFEAGSADVPGFRNINPNLDIGVFAFPPPVRGGQHTTLSGLDVTVGANPKTASPQAVFAFQNWCLSAKGANFCSSAINLSPVVKGVVPSVDPVQKDIIRISQNDFPVWYERPRINPGFAIWAKEGQGVFTGRLTSSQLLALMQKQSDAVKGN